MINAMLCNVAIDKGRGLMQWWANFLSVVGQLVGPGGPNSPPVYVLNVKIEHFKHSELHVTITLCILVM